jgi:predicted kinase
VSRSLPIHLIEGPVGAGKSTFAAQLAAEMGGVHLALDAWFARLYSPDRPPAGVMPWYMARKDRLVDLMWDHALALRVAGVTPILELGLVQRQARAEIYERARLAAVHLRVHVLDADRELRRERVARRNAEQGPTFSMVVPDAVFDLASDAWEPPDLFEAEERHIEFVDTAPRAWAPAESLTRRRSPTGTRPND